VLNPEVLTKKHPSPHPVSPHEGVFQVFGLKPNALAFHIVEEIPANRNDVFRKELFPQKELFLQIVDYGPFRSKTLQLSRRTEGAVGIWFGRQRIGQARRNARYVAPVYTPTLRRHVHDLLNLWYHVVTKVYDSMIWQAQKQLIFLPFPGRSTGYALAPRILKGGLTD
jgi:hypothetical protein